MSQMSDLLYIDWNPALDIPTALERAPRSKLASSVALISMLDSTPAVADLPSLVPYLIESRFAYAEVGRDVLVDMSTMDRLIHDPSHEWFAGFDEVWICSSTPQHGKPHDLRLTSDNHLQSEPTGLRPWMRESACVLALGDGDGLNFATFDADLADLLGRRATRPR